MLQVLLQEGGTFVSCGCCACINSSCRQEMFDCCVTDTPIKALNKGYTLTQSLAFLVCMITSTMSCILMHATCMLYDHNISYPRYTYLFMSQT